MGGGRARAPVWDCMCVHEPVCASGVSILPGAAALPTVLTRYWEWLDGGRDTALPPRCEASPTQAATPGLRCTPHESPRTWQTMAGMVGGQGLGEPWVRSRHLEQDRFRPALSFSIFKVRGRTGRQGS